MSAVHLRGCWLHVVVAMDAVYTVFAEAFTFTLGAMTMAVTMAVTVTTVALTYGIFASVHPFPRFFMYCR